MNRPHDDKLPLEELAAARYADANAFDAIAKEAWEAGDRELADRARNQAAAARAAAVDYSKRAARK